MSRRLARLIAVAVVSAAVLASAGCNKHSTTSQAETEGIWIDAGQLDYHIQGSRQLTPGAVPDSSYLLGLPQGVLEPGAKEMWFAVFVRIENKTDKPVPSAREFEILDTEHKSFKPLKLDPKANPYAYQPTTIPPKGAIPAPDSAQEFDSVQGAELLFKIPLDSYQNRPLEFVVHSADGTEPLEAKLNLDV